MILPDFIRITPLLAKKLDEYVRKGGRIFATGESGLLVNGTDFALDLGAKWLSTSPYRPDYFIPEADFGYLGKSSFVMYSQDQRIEASGETLGLRENPNFNRDVFHFCSHRHAPGDKLSREPAMTEGAAGIYIRWSHYQIPPSIYSQRMLVV